jgi:hypothetical protein
VPNDGGQITDAPLTFVVNGQGHAALVSWVSGGNLDGTKCGLPKLSCSNDLKTWQNCSPDPSSDTSLDLAYVRAAYGGDGQRSLVIQNRYGGGSQPAGVVFWRES